MRAVIFDLYGTLVDIETDEKSASFWTSLSARMTELFEARAVNHDELQRTYLELCTFADMSDSRRIVFDALHGMFMLGTSRLPSTQEMQTLLCEFRRLSTVQLVEFSFTRDLLQDLRTQGVRIGLLSNTEAELTECDFERVLDMSQFDAVHLSSRGFEKPDQRAMHSMCEELGVRPADAIMVGDTWDTDIRGGLRAGMQCVYLGEQNQYENVDDRVRFVPKPTLATMSEAIQQLLAKIA